ncbi:MAG: hypothetical protein LC648_09885 [Novosphingobium sp.]|nr:hypothetical protein [Novosphingobium sp.]
MSGPALPVFDLTGRVALITGALTPIEAMDAPLLFFASDLAAHVTGAELTIDDGQSL